MECFIVLGGPVIGFGLGGMFAFLVTQVGANQVHFNKWSEHPSRLPLESIGSHNCIKSSKL